MSAAGPAPRSLGGIVARNTLALAAGKFGVLGVGVASIAVTTRYLGAAGYGRFALALALLQTLGVLADAGLVAAVLARVRSWPPPARRSRGRRSWRSTTTWCPGRPGTCSGSPPPAAPRSSPPRARSSALPIRPLAGSAGRR